MSGHAETVRAYLRNVAPPQWAFVGPRLVVSPEQAWAALDALVAERDDAQRDAESWKATYRAWAQARTDDMDRHLWEREFLIGRAEKAKAERDEARAALATTVSRESALALIDESNRWEKAYAESRDEVAFLREALEAIRDLPTEHDLLFNAEAKALHYIAREVLAGGGRTPDETPSQEVSTRACPNCRGFGRVRDSMHSDSLPCGRCDGRGTIPDSAAAQVREGETP